MLQHLRSSRLLARAAAFVLHIRSATSLSICLLLFAGIQHAAAQLPVINSLSPSQGSTSGGTTVTITGQYLMGPDSSGPTSVLFGTANATILSASSTHITVTAPANSAGTTYVMVQYPLGGITYPDPLNADLFTYVAPPTVTAVSPTAGPTAGGTTVVITGTGFSAASPTGAVKFGATNATYSINSNTQITATSPANSAGTYDVTVTTVGGTSATSASDQFTYVPAPTVTSISPTAGPTGGGTSVTITGTNFSSNSAVSFGGTAAAAVTFNSATSLTVTSPAGVGTVDVRVTTLGGTSAVSAADQFTYVPVPTVSSVTPTSGPTGGGTSVLITGTGFAAASPTGAVKFGATNATYTINSNTQITATSPANSAGTYNVTVTTVGGTSNPSSSNQFTYVPPPIVTSISPTAGSTNGGTSVTITGTNFSGTTGVSFGTTPAANFFVTSGTQITAIAPAHPVGIVDVRVTTIGGTSATSAADQFTFVPAPTVTSVTPNIGPSTGGTSVTLTGTNFTSTSTVSFGGAAATAVTFNSSTSITATSPAGTGTVDVRVTTQGGISAATTSDQFTYLAVPTVTSITPSFGPTGGGTTVIITGTGLSGATAVQFGGTNAAALNVDSATQITATSPAGSAGTVYVTVTTAGGTSVTSPANQFTYIAAPVITSVSPSTGPVEGGTSVVITGSNFSGATGVRFDSTPAAYVLNSSTQITATAPAHAAGSVNVSVTTAGGTSAAGAGNVYVYSAIPVANAATSTVAYSSSNNVITPTLSGSPATSLSITTPPQHGSASVSGLILIYTPTEGYVGPDSLSYSANNSAGDSPPATVSITVLNASITVTPASLPDNPMIGVAYTETLSAEGNGIAPFTYAITAGSLPAGLTINPATGEIAGTATAAGPFSITVTATDQHGQTGIQAYTATVSPPLITIDPPTLANATALTSYNQALTVSGGTTPYSYAIVSGALPTGVQLNLDGSLSGQPTTPGTYNFELTVTDSSTGPDAPFTATQAYSLVVAAAPAVVEPVNVPTLNTLMLGLLALLAAVAGLLTRRRVAP